MSTIRLRVNKADAVYLYQLLESYEGLTTYTTLPGQKQDSFRDLELAYSESLDSVLRSVLCNVSAEIPLLISENLSQGEIMDWNGSEIFSVEQL